MSSCTVVFGAGCLATQAALRIEHCDEIVDASAGDAVGTRSCRPGVGKILVKASDAGRFRFASLWNVAAQFARDVRVIASTTHSEGWRR